MIIPVYHHHVSRHTMVGAQLQAITPPRLTSPSILGKQRLKTATMGTLHPWKYDVRVALGSSVRHGLLAKGPGRGNLPPQGT